MSGHGEVAAARSMCRTPSDRTGPDQGVTIAAVVLLAGWAVVATLGIAAALQ